MCTCIRVQKIFCRKEEAKLPGSATILHLEEEEKKNGLLANNFMFLRVRVSLEAYFTKRISQFLVRNKLFRLVTGGKRTEYFSLQKRTGSHFHF